MNATAGPYMCPVCGWDGLRKEAYVFRSPSLETCRCCGFTFGYDDLVQGLTFAEYRSWWIARGMPWYTPELKPREWDWSSQVLRAVTAPITHVQNEGMFQGDIAVDDDGSTHFFAVACVHPDCCYIGGNKGLLLKVLDRGARIHRVDLQTQAHVYGLTFLTEASGIATVNTRAKKIVRILRGGDDIRPISLMTAGYPIALTFPTPQVGYVAGTRGVLLRTTDGGATWVELSSTTLASLEAIAFWSPTIGVAVGFSGIMLRTTDQGEHWAQIEMDIQTTLHSVVCVDGGLGYAVGENGIIIRTVDAGATWASLDSGTDLELFTLAFTSPTIGYAAGESGVLLRTSDGGKSWQPCALPYRDTLTSLSFANEQVGYVVGRNSTMLRTSDCGETWASVALPSDI